MCVTHATVNWYIVRFAMGMCSLAAAEALLSDSLIFQMVRTVLLPELEFE